MKKRDGMKYICESRPGDKLILFKDHCLIVNPSFPVRMVDAEGNVTEVDFSKDKVQHQADTWTTDQYGNPVDTQR